MPDIQYSHIFHAFACAKISRRISLPHYAVLPQGKGAAAEPQPLYKRHRSLGPPSYSSKIMSSRSPGSIWRESIFKAPFKKTIGQYIPFPMKNVTIFLDKHNYSE